VKNVLRKIFVPKTDEVTEKWKNLHNDKIHNLYASPDIVIKEGCGG
jgi:hypothetical protein